MIRTKRAKAVWGLIGMALAAIITGGARRRPRPTSLLHPMTLKKQMEKKARSAAVQ